MGRLDGKVALITGTARGQGKAAAALFAREGAVVVGCDLESNEALNAANAEEIAAAGGVFEFRNCDVSDDEQARDLVTFALERFDRIDVLYNNAGAARFAPFPDLSPDAWAFTMRNEVDAVYFPCRHVVPSMLERRMGCIINTASIAGMIGMEIDDGGPVRGGVAHCAAKGAVISMTRALAQELGPYNIRVNSISPGFVDTPALAQRFENANFRAAAAHAALIGRMGTADDISFCALYLASEESSFMTGANLVVDGGWTAH